MYKPWGSFFKILSASQKVRTLKLPFQGFVSVSFFFLKTNTETETKQKGFSSSPNLVCKESENTFRSDFNPLYFTRYCNAVIFQRRLITCYWRRCESVNLSIYFFEIDIRQSALSASATYIYLLGTPVTSYLYSKGL